MYNVDVQRSEGGRRVIGLVCDNRGRFALGCLLSQGLFNIFLEIIIATALHEPYA